MEEEILMNRVNSLEPEERVARLVKMYTDKGWRITSQSPMLVQLEKKKDFSFLLFILLIFMWVFPAVLYLIWFAVQKPKVKTITP